jgi:AcrR family transcriptional regulator
MGATVNCLCKRVNGLRSASMPEWIPRESSAKGRLALTALEVFGAQGFDRVNVVELARTAGVTTGALYHHFGSKLGLYRVVRREAERRVLDRMEGAAAARASDGSVAAALAALLVGFDYGTGEGLAGLLAQPDPGTGDDGDGDRADAVESFLSQLTDRPGLPVARVLVAAWRAALQAVADGIPAADARRVVVALRVDVELDGGHPAADDDSADADADAGGSGSGSGSGSLSGA